MEKIIKYTTILMIIFRFIFAYEEVNYSIKYLGVIVADCKILKKDIIFNDKNMEEIIFKVGTRPFFNFIFPVKNEYSIILDDQNRIFSFSKNTSQPNVENILKTEFINDHLTYFDNDFEILPSYLNVFSMLHIIMSDQTLPKNFILEREGILYDAIAEYNEDKFMYKLYLKKNSINQPVIKNTDIFTWALFMDNANRKIFINPKTKLIEKCIFSKGLISITAILK
tara:strand:- start:361 stop:1035 length:675 start_codon:yes stop_codon:yes gene_type:complete